MIKSVECCPLTIFFGIPKTTLIDLIRLWGTLQEEDMSSNHFCKVGICTYIICTFFKISETRKLEVTIEPLHSLNVQNIRICTRASEPDKCLTIIYKKVSHSYEAIM